jgi:hypothetical protein
MRAGDIQAARRVSDLHVRVANVRSGVVRYPVFVALREA